jgi:hypothetical protein
MSKTKFRKIMPIIIVTALVAVLLAVPCAASDAEGAETMAITGALESAMAWMADNPESVIAAVITGVAGGVNLAGGVSNRKTRRSISRESAALQANSGRINNNAVELAGKVKADVTNMVSTVGKLVGEAVKALGTEMGKIANAIEQNTEEVKALKRETAANSFLLSEMIKDARMTTIRKDEILKGYEDIKNCPEANEDTEGGDGIHEGDDQA